jgi:hypothetical protein
MSFASEMEAIAKSIQNKLDLVVTGTMQGVIASAVLPSPVDTGNFAGNWLLGINEIPEGVTDIYDTVKTGTVVHLASLIPVNSAGEIYYLVNNTEYARDLENGYSPQSGPNGMIGLTKVRFPEIVRRAVAEVK